MDIKLQIETKKKELFFLKKSFKNFCHTLLFGFTVLSIASQ